MGDLSTHQDAGFNYFRQEQFETLSGLATSVKKIGYFFPGNPQTP
jgi:hypothetical protein